MSNPKLNIYLEDTELEALEGQTVAEALLSKGFTTFGTNHKGYHRGPFCLMGLCGQCLVKIGDKINARACTCTVLPGMKIYRQHDEGLSKRNDES